MSIQAVLSFIRPDWDDFINIKKWSTEFTFIFITSNIQEIKIFHITFINQGSTHLSKCHHISHITAPFANGQQLAMIAHALLCFQYDSVFQ